MTERRRKEEDTIKHTTHSHAPMSTSSSTEASSFRGLLYLPPTVLRRVLLCVDSEEVESLQQTCTGKFQQKPQAGHTDSSSLSSPSLHFPQGWSSYLSSLRSFLDDRASLLRESQLRSIRLQTIGYKQGLDAANDMVDQMGLLQAAFSRGFQSGAHTGWSDAVAKGLLAGMACFALQSSQQKPTHQIDEGMKQEIVSLNNAVNAKLLILPLANSTTPVKSSSSTARVAIQVSSETSCGDNCSCSKGESKNAEASPSACCKGTDGGSCACKEQTEEDAPPPLLPSAKIASVPGSNSLADISSADLYQRLTPIAERSGIAKQDFLLYSQLPKPTEPIVSNETSTNPLPAVTTTASSSSTSNDATESISRATTSKPAATKRTTAPVAKPPSIEDMQMAAMDW